MQQELTALNSQLREVERQLEEREQNIEACQQRCLSLLKHITILLH